MAISFYNVRLFLGLLLFACFTYKYSILFYISGGIFKFSGCHFQLSTPLGVLDFILRIHLKIWRQMSKSGFFLSRSHVRQDSWFSSKILRIPTRSGWFISDVKWDSVFNKKRLHMNVMCGRVLEFALVVKCLLQKRWTTVLVSFFKGIVYYNSTSSTLISPTKKSSVTLPPHTPPKIKQRTLWDQEPVHVQEPTSCFLSWMARPTFISTKQIKQLTSRNDVWSWFRLVN